MNLLITLETSFNAFANRADPDQAAVVRVMVMKTLKVFLSEF